jgi:hypothetical protein
MTHTNLNYFFGGLILGLVTGFFVLAFVVENHAEEFRAEAIKNGAAYYHPITAKFTWGKLQVPQ